MAKVLNEPLSIGAKTPVGAVILSDVHAPFHSATWLDRAVRFKRRVDDDTVLILAGDTCDYNSLSSHTSHVDPPTLEFELLSAQSVIRRLADTYSHVYVTLGNHEFRASREQKGMTPKLVMRQLVDGLQDNITASPYWYSWLNKRRWFVVHPQRYSKIPGRTPIGIAHDLSGKYGRAVNVVSGHEHHRAAVAEGQLVGICNPCLQDPEITPYIMHHNLSNGFKNWQLGFTHIRADGSFRVYGAEDAGELD